MDTNTERPLPAFDVESGEAEPLNYGVSPVIAPVTRSQRAMLCWTGFLQVIFVSMNTIYITQQAWFELIFTSFCISFLWSGNVKRIAFGDWIDRVVYASGAAVGCAAGVLIAGTLTNLL